MKPILFNTEMVRAILEGRKTVTRRVVKPQHKNAVGFYVVRNVSGEIVGLIDYDEDERQYEQYMKPPYRPGDILYVRETWSRDRFGEHFLFRAFPGKGMEPEKQDKAMRELKLKWRPSIHMPKKAARIFLRVTGVRVERLKDMTAEDSLREGVKLHLAGIMAGEPTLKPFADLWDSTIKYPYHHRYGWAANPWVWVIEFERCEKLERGRG